MQLFMKTYLSLLLILLLSGCSRYYSVEHKDLAYDPHEQLKLDVYTPRNPARNTGNVMVFFHGGNWMNGSKKLYRFLGRGLARKGVVAVIPDYRLYPKANYIDMSMDAAHAVEWTREFISCYGGDPGKIFVSGHSAGGQMAALISTDNTYFDSLHVDNPIRGCVLIDPFGLDMFDYLKRGDKYKFDVYRAVFTRDTTQWKKASPQFHLHDGMPPFLVFRGGWTYHNIVEGTEHFEQDLKRYQENADIIVVPGKRHTGMIFSFANPHKVAYRQITHFMTQVKNSDQAERTGQGKISSESR
jgi:acetyl esterase/lipase